MGSVLASAADIRFEDVTESSGITFVHDDGSEGERFIVESVASGLATFDYDGDGLIDILFLNGKPLTEDAPGDRIGRNALYRNLGDWKFQDVTTKAGVGDSGFHLGVCAGDYDNDGYTDFFVSNFGPDALYRNNGNGTFSNVTAQAGVANGDRVGAGAAFLDYDRDGDLDLFVANYCQFTLKRHQARRINGYPAYSGPAIYGPVPDTLFRNDGGGRFTDVSQESGIAGKAGTGMGVVVADYDSDGDSDIIVGNDAMANFVWRNEGDGTFKEVGLFSGLAYDSHGIGQGTMGIECADFDNDGRLDFYMTSYQQQWAILYRNDGGGFFSDATRTTGAGTETYAEVTWGTGMVDFDNDGLRDIFIACGHLQDNIHRWDDTTSFEAENLVLQQTVQGKFQPVPPSMTSSSAPKYSSRGAVFDDLDNDGDLDAIVLNTRAKPTVLRNLDDSGNHWLQIQLQGTKSNRDGVGARITLEADDRKWVDEIHSGRSYQSHYGLRAHFGLGLRTRVDRMVIDWPSGARQELKNVAVDQNLIVTEP